MKAAYEASGGSTKGTYFGYSAGTMQMMIALTKFEQELLNYVEKVNFLAPCSVLGPNALSFIEGLKTPGTIKAELGKAGVYALFGPNFSSEVICEKSSADACILAQSIMNPELFPTNYHQPMGTTFQEHIEQIATVSRFQTISANWSTKKQTTEYDLEGIASMPIALIVAENDEMCSASDA